MIYSKSWKFLKESRNYFYIIFSLFVTAIIIGFIFPVFFSGFIKQFIEGIARQTEGLNFFQLFVFILQNNLLAGFSGMISGIFLGAIPLFLVLLNGYVIGFVSSKVAASTLSNLWRLLPHGIFEIPALILSLGLGLRLGMFIFKKKGKRKKDFIYSFGNSMKVFLYIIIPLLVIAALIEALLIFLLK